MAHLTLQLGAAIVMPFGTVRRSSSDTTHWKARSLREASEVDPGLPVLASRFNRYAHVRLPPSASARRGSPLDGNEV